tara:strand:+ start:608 stop:1252 length:645 start_codon:yes stop_codon:yes gene_type:complete
MAPKALLNRLVWDAGKEIASFAINLWLCVLGIIFYLIALAFSDFSPFVLTMITSAFCLWTAIYLPAGKSLGVGLYMGSIPFLMWLFYLWVASFFGPLTWIFFLGFLLWIIDKTLDEFATRNTYVEKWSDEWLYRERRVIFTISAWLFVFPFFGMIFFSMAWLAFVITALFFAIFFSPPINLYIAALPATFIAGVALYAAWGTREMLKFSQPKFY